MALFTVVNKDRMISSSEIEGFDLCYKGSRHMLNLNWVEVKTSLNSRRSPSESQPYIPTQIFVGKYYGWAELLVKHHHLS